VVISILAVLAGLLLPAITTVKEAARSADCAGRLRQLGIGLESYASDWDGRWPAPMCGGRYWMNALWEQLDLGDETAMITNDIQGLRRTVTACSVYPLMVTSNRRGYGMVAMLPPNLTSTAFAISATVPPRPASIRVPSATVVLADNRGIFNPVGDWHIGSLDLWTRQNMIGYVHRGRANLLCADLHVQGEAQVGLEALYQLTGAATAGSF
jgi:hypothetical protein